MAALGGTGTRIAGIVLTAGAGGAKGRRGAAPITGTFPGTDRCGGAGMVGRIPGALGCITGSRGFISESAGGGKLGTGFLPIGAGAIGAAPACGGLGDFPAVALAFPGPILELFMIPAPYRLFDCGGRVGRGQPCPGGLDESGMRWIPGREPKENDQNAIFTAIDRYRHRARFADHTWATPTPMVMEPSMDSPSTVARTL